MPRRGCTKHQHAPRSCSLRSVPTLGANDQHRLRRCGAVRAERFGEFLCSASTRIHAMLTAMLTTVLTAVLTTEHSADSTDGTDGTNDIF